MTGRALVLVALAAALLASALGRVYAVHASRTAFSQVQALHAERDEMNVEWGRLQLEQATWSTHARVEQVAAERLDMRTPDPAGVVVVRP